MKLTTQLLRSRLAGGVCGNNDAGHNPERQRLYP
jgi:hypothetical protein